MNEQRPVRKAAWPGDEDLDIDIDGVTLTAVVRGDKDLLVYGGGGFGWWVCADGSRARFAADAPDTGVTDFSMVAGFPGASEETIAAYASLLEDWRDRAVPLRICGARGKAFAIIEDSDNWLALPRGPVPDGC